ncbi:hotdog fold domain-containing protein [Antribacter gilvus]|uniref:hotdog fold domain-containing protein n=1 Tax=Antribacter gilvus TaxID=2304675 RepID=UPI000F773FB2|nr:hotdog fold domain-containing protein [Antribacter gilvus]
MTTQVYAIWQKLKDKPLGKRVFGIAFGLKAPYFRTIHARYIDIRPNYAEVVVPKRWSVHNHLGTVHAIAVCNGLEAAMGVLAEATVPANKRWIPKGMDVAYTAKSTSDITCTAETDPEQWTADEPDLPVRVTARRADGVVVAEGVIRLWVTEKPQR